MGPVIGGLAGHFLLSAPVFIAALLTMANLLWAYLALPESLASDKRATTFRWNHLNPFAPFVHVFQTTTLRIAFVSAFLFYFAGTMLQGNISVFLKDILRFGPSGISLLLLIVGIMDITSQGYLTGKLLPRFGEASLSRVGLAINAVGLVMVAAIAFFPSSIFLYTAVVVFTLGDGLFQPSINSLIANAAPHGMQGRVQGANQAQQSVARMLGPLLGALLYTLGPSIPYFAGAILILIALATLFLPVTAIKASSLQGIDTARNVNLR